MPQNVPRPLAFFALVVGAVAMGCSPVFVRLADVGPFASAFWRVALALPLLWLWHRHAAEPRPAESWRFAVAVIASGIAFAGDLIFWHLAILNTTIANATLLATLAPVWVFLVAFLVLGHALRRAEVIGLAACLIGGSLLVRDSFDYAPERLWGDAAGFATSLFFGLYIVFITHSRRFSGPARVMLLSTAVTAIVLLCAALLAGERFLPGSPAGWLTLVLLALISQVAGQGLLAYALGQLPVAFSSLVVFLEAIAAALLGWLAFSEHLGAWQWIGGGFVLFGIWIARPVLQRAATDDSGRVGLQ
ncbi:MAG TPA: DMT family transporter [Beijerinckiaceae bacterium]|nr:DMT family transporter [Beijerinckiaceae bacterium]